ncbi:MAG: sigma-70 family RNA polymerase sigma factor [Bacteroidales bacterium]|jgi:RNA polymerase sigma-70 factor (ECF subfamily)|nr:sigma-70 family RNA polymerase sigma factor [Bacteroidales bacterium]
MEIINDKSSPMFATAKATEDYELVCAALHNGDRRAYAQLMDRYKESLYFKLIKMTGSETDADDMTIEAFGKAFSNLHTYSPEYAFSTWLFRIATNNCIDYMRKKRIKPIPLDRPVVNNDDRFGFEMRIADLSADPEMLIIKEQKNQNLRAIVDKLKPHYRILIELRYYKEYSYEEIAEKLDLPVGTVKAKLFRAKEFLYNILKNSADKI